MSEEQAKKITYWLLIVAILLATWIMIPWPEKVVKQETKSLYQLK